MRSKGGCVGVAAAVRRATEQLDRRIQPRSGDVAQLLLTHRPILELGQLRVSDMLLAALSIDEGGVGATMTEVGIAPTRWVRA